MGLFDRLIVEFALPDAGAAAVKEWQTKDLPDPYLHTYKITAEGRLMFERRRDKDRSDPDVPKDTLESPTACWSTEHDGWNDMNYHGILNFYGDAHIGELLAGFAPTEALGKGPKPAAQTEWFEYQAKFTDGKLVAVERVQRIWGSANPE